MNTLIRRKNQSFQWVMGSFIAGLLIINSVDALADTKTNTAIQISTSPVRLNLQGKNRALVKRGSYLVNTIGSCSGCHTNPEFATGGNPFNGEPTGIDVANYLAGGTPFGTDLVSANITPDAQGNPAGLTLAQFIKVMRTGQDPDDATRTLQVMPWPYFKGITDNDLAAIYEYLRAVPSIITPATP